MLQASIDSLRTKSKLNVGGKTYSYYSLPVLQKAGIGDISRLPYSLKILLENMLRCEDGKAVSRSDIEAMVNWNAKEKSDQEIAFTPARVILQDFTGVPAVVDLAVMRDAMAELGGDPSKINPQVPSDLVIDHSVQVDFFGRDGVFRSNVEKEFERNQERYTFLRWGQGAFDNFRVVPPATGIVHQVNLEYLASVVFDREIDGEVYAYPDTLVGTDSHTTMINGLGVLGWGVGGIEAEAAMLGQPISLLIPQVIGFRLHGNLPEGATATDLVLTITEMLRAKGVVGKFVEFYGPGLSSLSLADRATLGNMSPEYGATCAIFPIDAETVNFLAFTARDPERVALVEAYAKAQGLFHTPESPEPVFTDTLELDLAEVVPCISGPKRPQDRILLSASKPAFEKSLGTIKGALKGRDASDPTIPVSMVDPQTGQPTEFDLKDGAVVIAAITSCTNTSNPSVMLGAGLLAKKAVERGLNRRPWVKTSLAPGSQVVTEYLREAGLDRYLDQLGFNLVGYGCTTCIGNSGPVPAEISKAIQENQLVACSVLSGNRNFEGRISPDVRANYLASPPLVVAYALAGRMDIDLMNDPIGQDKNVQDVFLKDLWPTQAEMKSAVQSAVQQEMYASRYADVFTGDESWGSLPVPEGDRYAWQASSTYIRRPTFFDGMGAEPGTLGDISGMRVLAKLGDSVTTDHISPAGSIPANGPAGRYLIDHGVEPVDFNSFGSRRGNHEVMVRGTFANIRLRNRLVEGVEGGYTRVSGSDDVVSIYDASVKYQGEETPLMILAGKEYGSGSSRDWAAKGTRLLGVRLVIAESYERIHRSNLIGMGILPTQFEAGENAESLGLTGQETYDLIGLDDSLTPDAKLQVRAVSEDGTVKEFSVVARVDTPNEVQYFRHGGILHFVLRSLMKS
ncbi:MAG: aconitate hydratase AcnA [Acidobacteriota bacterium]|nr:MAG: aconitate hydratase AcnA [Acidobacteriota bacterium]